MATPVPPPPSSKDSNEGVALQRPGFQLVTSRGFVDWMASERLALALTTYHVGGLILLGRKPSGELGIHVSAFDRAMGLWTDGQRIWLGTALGLLRLENVLPKSQARDGADRFFVPRAQHVTGDVDIHDVAVDGAGQPVFVNTRFSCLAALDERYNFKPVWKPPFISQLAPEDRCHLNGMALEAGRPKYVTVVAKSDVADGWRDFRSSGGLVLDVDSGEPIATGLSMPHSPRLHDGRLWVLNAGSGHLGFIDRNKGAFEPVAFLPGYARGLAFHGKYAVVGLSKPRREHAFQGLPLDANLAAKGAAPRCGLEVIDTATGSSIHWLRIESAVEELYDVAVLPETIRPRGQSFSTKNAAHHFCFEENGRLQSWSLAPSPQPGA